MMFRGAPCVDNEVFLDLKRQDGAVDVCEQCSHILRCEEWAKATPVPNGKPGETVWTFLPMVVAGKPHLVRQGKA